MSSAAPRPAFSINTRLGTPHSSIAQRSKARIWSRDRSGITQSPSPEPQRSPARSVFIRKLPVVAQELRLGRGQRLAARPVSTHDDRVTRRRVFVFASDDVDDVDAGAEPHVQTERKLVRIL